MILVAALFLVLVVGRVILYLVDGGKVVWDSVQVLGLVSWIVGTWLALYVMGWLPSLVWGT